MQRETLAYWVSGKASLTSVGAGCYYYIYKEKLSLLKSDFFSDNQI